MTAATGDSLSFGYDTLKRLNRVTAKSGSSIIMNTAYAYRDVSWNRGSAQVEFRNVRLGSDSGMLLEGKKYVYDDVGNLKEIRESTGKYNKLVEYTYDSQNQLTSEAYYKSGEAEAYITYNYTYDTAGNLLTVSQKKGDTTTLLQTYTYGDAQWHDLLTAVNGQAITYDASGNPLSYGGWSFGWQNGRQLKTASKTSDGKTETLEYSYDADGIRTSKTYTVETFTQLPDYTVTFTADGATVKTMTVEDGYTLKDSDYPAVPTKTGYTGEWVKYTSAVHSNVTVQAKYTAVSTDHTVTFKANGKTVKTMVVPDGYVLQDSDYPPIPPRVGYKGSWSKVTTAIRRDTVIYASYMPNGGGIVIPTQPTSPGEIMSGGAGEPVENEPVEADASAEDETVSPQGMHVTGTQTVTHEYLTLNGKVARETIRTNNTLTAVLDFVYDESGKPFALKYSTNGTSFQTYYYVLNLQGDVVKLIHYIPGFEYESVATYEYDAWGNIVSSSGRLAEINPLRYRGYYYDNETGFYYLQSRYYDPANRRFINADSYASTGQGFVGTNMFAYCNNSPVFLVDSYGNMAGKSHLVYSSEGGSRYRNVQNDGKGARSAELEEYLNGYLLPYDSPYLKANIEYLGNLYWDNNTEEYWLAMTKCSLISLFLSSKIPAAGILGAAATFLDVFNHFFGEDTPSDAWHDFYKVSIDVYIETSDFVGISHREYIYVWANNSPTSAFWYQVPTANCTGGNS